MVKFVEHRVADRRMLRLIQKWLNAGVMEEGKWSEAKTGSPPRPSGVGCFDIAFLNAPDTPRLRVFLSLLLGSVLTVSVSEMFRQFTAVYRIGVMEKVSRFLQVGRSEYC